MISEEAFLKKFKNVNLPKEMLEEFYNSIIESITYASAGSALFHLLLKVEKEQQWTVLQKIDNTRLAVYKGAQDKELVKEFVKGIKIEKKIRDPNNQNIKISKGELHPFTILRKIIIRRAGIYAQMFALTKKEIEKCEARAEELLKDMRRLFMGKILILTIE